MGREGSTRFRLKRHRRHERGRRTAVATPLSIAFAVVLVGGCATTPRLDADSRDAQPNSHLFDAATAIQDQWQHLPLRGETDYRVAFINGRLAIQAVGRHSASGLIRRVTIDPTRCPIIEWSWCVTKLQQNADLRVKDREDVAAAIFVLFGDPGFFFDPKPVPTLRYVWTNGAIPTGAVIDNPYLPGTVRSIVVKSGTEQIGTWVMERRNMVDDYVRAFGSQPTNGIHAIALFTDNDQTKEPVEAYYGSGRVVCTSK